MSSSSLSTVVSDLVRAQLGSSVSNTVKDDDLDRHVAELILREAKKKAERYGQQGIRAYISSNLDSNAPRPNKRFLTSIIKNTDEHNKTILRAQALAAEEVKRERRERERDERRKRAEEAADAERLRRSGRSSKRRRVDTDEGWDRWDGRTAERKNIHRDWEHWDGNEKDERDEGPDKGKRRQRSRTLEGEERHRRRSRSREHGSSRRSHRRRGSRSPSPRRKRSSRTSAQLLEPERAENPGSSNEGSRKRTSHTRRAQSRSRSPSEGAHRKRKRSPTLRSALDDVPDQRRSHSPLEHSSSSAVPEKQSRTSLPPHSASSRHTPKGSSRKRSESPVSDDDSDIGPQLPMQLPSKMDKYFEESYDPRLDVAPLAPPTVPSTGLIDNAQFEGWDTMLELIRLRQQDKLEKKRLERLGLLPKDKGKSKKGALPNSSAEVADRWSSQEVSVMDIQYNKRGSVREWDMGKDIK